MFYQLKTMSLVTLSLLTNLISKGHKIVNQIRNDISYELKKNYTGDMDSSTSIMGAQRPIYVNIRYTTYIYV